MSATIRNLSFGYSEAQEHIFFDSRALGRFRFFPKGRRLGATRGAAHAFIEWMLQGKQLLWGDTTHANIKRYVERYFITALKKNQIPYSWNAQDSCLKVGAGFTDFRSSDRPENWEGFGYHVIFLNEAGIILDDAYMYHNAVLPMLMDFAESQLIAAGTPKLRQGTGRLFKELVDKALRNEPGYYTKTFSTYDNPFLPVASVDMLAGEISEIERGQEIYGKFLEPGGEMVKREYLRYATPPADLRDMVISMGVDLALQKTAVVKKGADPDYLACVVMGRERFGLQRTFVLDAVRRRVSFGAGLILINAMYEKWKPQIVGIEDVQFQAAVVEQLLVRTNMPCVGITPDKNKVVRFTPAATRYEHGLIYHAPGLPPEFEDELLAFPNGGHDDFVDAEQMAFMCLPDVTIGGIATTSPRDNAGAAAIIQTGASFGTVSSGTNMRGFQ